MIKKSWLMQVWVLCSFSGLILCGSVEVSAQDTLAIVGPVEAFEYDSVVFSVLLNDAPVQARLSFDDGSDTRYTDSETGNITLAMPAAPEYDKTLQITASVPGGLYVVHTIVVKNSSNVLSISWSPAYVGEQDVFTVLVLNKDQPVEEATVWFNSKEYVTNSAGKVQLTAPDVLVTTTFGLIVNKTGFQQSSKMITIYEQCKGVQLMMVTVSSMVAPEETGIEISVRSDSGGVEDARVLSFYENVLLYEYFTNVEGIVYITAPQQKSDEFFMVIVSKSGFDTYGSLTSFKVFLQEKTLMHDLVLHLSASELYEGDQITVEVTDELGAGVENAELWLDSTPLNQMTDSNGLVVFTAPAVFMDEEHFLYAVKQGYNFGEERVTIREREQNENPLFISTVSVVGESMVFEVLVKDVHNYAVGNVEVLFNMEQQLTDKDGRATFIAPEVSYDVFYKIQACKYGFLPAAISLQIIDQSDSNHSATNSLILCMTPSILERNEFIVTVRNELGGLVSNAQVFFMDTAYYTDARGVVTLMAPEVGWDTSFEVTTVKSGYQSASVEILVKNTSEFQYWFLVAVIMVIFIFGVMAYYRYRDLLV